MLSSCDEDEKRPLIQDATPPGPVSNVEVENISGGAIVTYTLPNDEDVLYVEARYELVNGKTAIAKSSIYKKTLKIEGLGDTSEHVVQLYSVDQSENRSSPVEVIIKPTKPPVQLIRESLEISADFGGVSIFWENTTEADIAVVVSIENEVGDTEQVGIKYSYLARDEFAVRGFDTIPRVFSIFIRDRYDNISNSLVDTITPLFEEKLDQNLMKELDLPHSAPTGFGWVVSNLFDDNPNSGYHTATGWSDPDPLPEYTDVNPHILTIDLGVEAKLSRFSFLQRPGDWLYTHHNPRFFDVWGTAEINDQNKDGSFTGWTKLIENGEVIKPSGLPLGQLSNDDLEAAGRGHEFTFPLDSEPVRYIRFVNIESWSGNQIMHMMEMDFWGEIQ